MALFIVSLFVLAPFALLAVDLTGRGRKAPAETLAPSYSELLQQGRSGSRTAQG